MADAPKFTLAEVVAFLCGEAPLDGVWFGDWHPTESGMFWWRKHLRAAAAGVPAAPAPDQYGTALATMPKTAEEVAWLRPCSLGACPQPEVCGKRGSCAERGGQQ